MSDTLKVVLPALLALAGTLVGLYIAHRRWKRERADSHSAEYSKERRAFYLALWEKVEKVHVDMRIELVTQDEFTSKLKAINALILTNGIYLDRGDQKLVNDYLTSLFDYQRVLIECPDGGKLLEGWFMTLNEIPLSYAKQAEAVRTSQEALENHRVKLMQRVKGILSDSAG
jgi:hypothetical protein